MYPKILASFYIGGSLLPEAYIVKNILHSEKDRYPKHRLTIVVSFWLYVKYAQAIYTIPG